MACRDSISEHVQGCCEWMRVFHGNLTSYVWNPRCVARPGNVWYIRTCIRLLSAPSSTKSQRACEQSCPCADNPLDSKHLRDKIDPNGDRTGLDATSLDGDKKMEKFVYVACKISQGAFTAERLFGITQYDGGEYVG